MRGAFVRGGDRSDDAVDERLDHLLGARRYDHDRDEQLQEQGPQISIT
jgi:hypothetical protein